MSVTSKLVLAFVTLLLGVVIIGVIATQQLAVTDKTAVSSEVHNVLPTIETGRNTTDINETITYTLTNAPTGWKVNDCPLTSVVITNTTGGNTLTVTTDYTLTASAGTIVFKNTTATVALIGPNSTLVDYYYCPDDYMNLTWGRTVINMVPGFFALAILGASLLLFYSVAKDYDII